MRRNLLRTSASNLYIYQNLPVLIPMKKPCSNPPIEPTVFSYKHVEDGHMRHCLVSNRALSFVRERFVAVATAGTLLILAAGCPGQSALAQGTTVIPPPPNPSHEPEFDPIDPHRAFDPKTGQNLVWDCNKKTWMDTKTGQGIGFNGRHDGNGDVIPPPSNPSHEPEFDPVDPNRAFDPKTGQNLIWDRDQHTWRDTKTGRGLGFSGRRVKEDCPPPRAGTTPPPPVSVLLESVQPRIGNNPWDPGNVFGGGPVGPPISPTPTSTPGTPTPTPTATPASGPGTPTPTPTPTPTRPPTATPTPTLTPTPLQTGCATSFSTGSYACSGTCGITATGLSVTSGSGTMTANPFGANMNVMFSCSGSTATSQSTNLIILGLPGHRSTLTSTSMTGFTIFCQNNSGGTCTSTCSR